MKKSLKKISQELEEGFESGKLNRKNMFFVSKQSNGKKLEDMRKVCNYIGAGVIETTFYRSYQTSYGGSIFVENQPAEVVLDLINVKSVSTLKEGNGGRGAANKTVCICDKRDYLDLSDYFTNTIACELRRYLVVHNCLL